MEEPAVEVCKVSWICSHLRWVGDNSNEDYRCGLCYSLNSSIPLKQLIASLKVREIKMILEELARLFGETLIEIPINRLENVRLSKRQWESKLEAILANPYLQQHFLDHKEEGYIGASRASENKYVCTYSSKKEFKRTKRKNDHVPFIPLKNLHPRDSHTVSHLSLQATLKHTPKKAEKAMYQRGIESPTLTVETSTVLLHSSSENTISDLRYPSSNTPSNSSQIPPSSCVTKSLSNFKKKVKKENIERDDVQTPQNDREFQLLSYLKPMGFTTSEILSAIRLNKNISTLQNIAQQSDSLMLWMVTQREEADEARKLDEARIQSEEANAEMTQSREAVESTLKHTPENELFSESSDHSFFKTSYIIQSKGMRSLLKRICKMSLNCKQLVIQYLLLEKKAIKWYGAITPKAYFFWEIPKLFLSMKDGSETKFRTFLHDQIETLQIAFYSLNEQSSGGVPNVFLRSNEHANRSGFEFSTNAYSEDDEVEVLQVCKSPANQSMERERSSDLPSVVIEIN